MDHKAKPTEDQYSRGEFLPIPIEAKKSRWGLRGKTFWDWLQLLIVPLVLVGIGLLFEMQQAEREERRAEAERNLAEQRAQDEALQAYLDQMTQLILDRKLLEADEDDPVYTLAQARTSTVITRLDADHNRNATRFLSDSGLAGRVTRPGMSSISLFSEIDLSGADLSGADLSDADLRGADLSDADLILTDLSGADLSEANLSEANLSFADLSDAYLFDAYLFLANLSNAHLSGADLSSAALNRADLSDADLRGADLSGAILGGADLSGAYLFDADLRDAKGWTEEQLLAAYSLDGATMPNGQKYEEWIKD